MRVGILRIFTLGSQSFTPTGHILVLDEHQWPESLSRCFSAG
jgi:hypothetical protein